MREAVSQTGAALVIDYLQNVALCNDIKQLGDSPLQMTCWQYPLPCAAALLAVKPES